MSCPLCSIPERENVLYEDDQIYLVHTLEQKGHSVRVMACTKRHTDKPSFEEKHRCLLKLYDYMTMVHRNKPWYLVDSTHCSIPDHFHYVACNPESTDFGETQQLEDTPKLRLPLKPNVLIGIPCYNEEEHIGRVVQQSQKYGIVMVYCDGCTDESAYRAYQNFADRIIICNTNQGYGAALDNLFKAARDGDYDALVILDGDGQHNPEDIPRFLWALEHADIVIGNRFLGEHDTPVSRQLVIKTINGLLGVGDSQCGFRAYSREALRHMRLEDSGMGASIEVLRIAKDNGLQLAEVPCSLVYGDTEHTHDAFTHGRMLLESLYWGLVWLNPVWALGLPSLVFGGVGLYWIFKTAYLYQTLDTFATGLAVSGFGSLMLCVMLFLAATYILVAKRQLVEMKR